MKHTLLLFVLITIAVSETWVIDTDDTLFTWIAYSDDGSTDTNSIDRRKYHSIDWQRKPISLIKRNIEFGYARLIDDTIMYDDTLYVYDTVYINYGESPLYDDLDFSYTYFDEDLFIESVERISNRSKGFLQFLMSGEFTILRKPDWITVRKIARGVCDYDLDEDIETICPRTVSDSLLFTKRMITSNCSVVYSGEPYYSEPNYKVQLEWNLDTSRVRSDRWEIEATNAYGNSTAFRFRTKAQRNSCD